MQKDIKPGDRDWNRFFGPSQVDHMVRQAIQMCWMGLPDEKRTIDQVETQVRRIVDRALKDFRDDGKIFKKK